VDCNSDAMAGFAASAMKATLVLTMNDTSVLNIAKHNANVAGMVIDPRPDGLHNWRKISVK
jgi:hypothetical protein